MVEPLSSFRFPERTEVEVVLVRLADGRVVARTKDELEAADQAAEQKEGTR